MKFPKITKDSLKAFLISKGWLAKIAGKKMTEEMWAEADTAVKEKFGVSLNDAMVAAAKLPVLEQEQRDALIALAGDGGAEPGAGADAVEPGAGADAVEPGAGADAVEPGAGADAVEPGAGADAVEPVSVAEGITRLMDRISLLEGQPDNQATVRVAAAGSKATAVLVLGGPHSSTHIFGQKADFFSRDKWWNEIAAQKTTPKGRRSQSQISAFKDEFDQYGEQLSARVAQLHDLGVLGMDKMASSIDYSDFTGTGWGDEYVIRRMDALIAYIKTLPSVSNIFPVQFGVQNKMVMTKSFFGEFSQAWQTGSIFKGDYTMQPEEAKVDNMQFKHQFTDLKNLEKEYIGYLNREGQDPMKWTFVEWLMVQTISVLTNEKNTRRVIGVRVEPVTAAGWTNPFLFGADGIIRRLQVYMDDFKIQAHTDYGLYTPATILTVVEGFVSDVNKKVPSMRGNLLYMNEKHVPWYMAAYRTKYGTDLDFTGSKLDVKNYDIDGIIAVPNMGNNNYLMWITLPGNMELYEDLPGEMEKIYFERSLETLIAASWWAEGSGAFRTGKKFDTAALLAVDDYKHQFIFLTDPFIDVAADATTVDGSLGNRFKTGVNTGATDITNVTSNEMGVVYRIVCGDITFVSTVTKAALFSEISATWTPTAIGDWLEVYMGPDSKFYELGRVVT